MANGGVIGKANVPSTTVASGVWTLDELFAARDLNIWPKASLSPSSVEYLVIAGGGGSGGVHNFNSHAAGGGGAGGYRSSIAGESSGGGASAESFLSVTPLTSHTVTVGGGGARGQNNIQGSSGVGSVFSTVTSVGGGRGGSSFVSNDAQIGGSGGGGARTNPGRAGTLDQGFAGGAGNPTVVIGSTGGGGGGAGSLGVNGVAGGTGGGNGGSGVSSGVTGVSIGRAGGGGGGASGTSALSSATDGGGRGGRTSPLTQPLSGSANTGGGGGGGAHSATVGGNGGSGVVIVRYDDRFQDLQIGAGLQFRDSAGATQNGAGTRVAPSYSLAGFKVYEFRGGTGNVEF